MSEQVYKSSEILKEVRRLKKLYPKAVYNKPKGSLICFYSKGKVINGPETCGCIVGQAIRVVYPSLFKELIKYEKKVGESKSVDSLENLTGNSIQRLSNIQGNQDAFEYWGDCKEV